MNIRKKFRLETKGIETVVDQDGHESVSWASLNCRVVDEASGMPIGLVLHVRDGERGMKYEAKPLYTDSGKPLTPPKDGWGPEFYTAASELWETWNKTLPYWSERMPRYFSRWLDVYWWVVGLTMGFLISLALQ